MRSTPFMSPIEKKQLIKKRLSEGDKRSYNQIKADLELEVWAERMSGHRKPFSLKR